MGFIPISIVDLLDIVLVAILLFWLYRKMKGSSAIRILSGVIVIYLIWILVKALNMGLLSTILGQIISVGMIALLIIFQPELRRFLQMIGMRRGKFHFVSRFFTSEDTDDTAASPIVSACIDMSQEKTGALIVLTRQDKLPAIVENGIQVDATITASLLKNIFFKNAPLHDGAVIIDHNRIVAAKCILPMTQREVPKEYGTRHRSAIGMSDVSDAVVIVVSEETGGISIAKKGKIRRDIPYNRFQSLLHEAMADEK